MWKLTSHVSDSPFVTGQYTDGSDPGVSKPHVIEKKRQQYCSSTFILKKDRSLELGICSYYEKTKIQRKVSITTPSLFEMNAYP